MGENCELHRHCRSGRRAGKTITQASCAQPFRHLAPPITRSATQDPSDAPPRHGGPCLCLAYFSVGGIGCVTPAVPRPPTPVPWTSRTSRSKTRFGVKGERFTPKAGHDPGIGSPPTRFPIRLAQVRRCPDPPQLLTRVSDRTRSDEGELR
jgi:hypothetical protein